MLSPARKAGGSSERNRGDVAALRCRLEPRRSRRLHERLRARLTHQLHGGWARTVRLAAAVRPLSEELFRARQVARFALVRRAARACPDAWFCVRDGALQALAPGLRRCQPT